MSAPVGDTAREWPTTGTADVSAFFADTISVDRALAALTASGLPRDLIEVVVAPAAAHRFYGDAARAPGRETARYAGIGGLAGLILGAAVSLTAIAAGGFAAPGPGALAQLLGPNLATVLGALIGGLVGTLVRQRPAARHARAAAAPEAVLVVARASRIPDGEMIAAILTAAGGREARVDISPTRWSRLSTSADSPEVHRDA